MDPAPHVKTWTDALMHALAVNITDDALATVAHNVAAIRAQLDLSQPEVARRGRTSQRSVSNLERRVGSPTLAVLAAVAHGLNVPPFVLFFPGADDPETRRRLIRLYHAYLSTDERGRAAIDAVAEQQGRYIP